MLWIQRLTARRALLIAAALIAAQALIELAMGRLAICKCGYVKLWEGVVQSAGNSQHFSDWYTFSHIIHGFVFYWLAYLVFPRASVGFRFVAAVLVEGSWEVFENTPMIIERYRSATISLDYYGDSILNSVMDTLAMIVGFVAAARLPVGVIVAAGLGMELWTLLWIRDNLILNVIMLVHPFETILAWQNGRGG